jgi:hypothetical protein
LFDFVLFCFVVLCVCLLFLGSILHWLREFVAVTPSAVILNHEWVPGKETATNTMPTDLTYLCELRHPVFAILPQSIMISTSLCTRITAITALCSRLVTPRLRDNAILVGWNPSRAIWHVVADAEVVKTSRGSHVFREHYIQCL